MPYVEKSIRPFYILIGFIGMFLSYGETWRLVFTFLPVYFFAKKECRSL